MTPRTAATAFRIVAVAEALSWIGLLAGMFVKYVPETSELGVQVFGPIHGAVFVAYVVVAAGRGRRAALGRPGRRCSRWPPRSRRWPRVWFERWATRTGALPSRERRAGLSPASSPRRRGLATVAVMPEPVLPDHRPPAARPHRAGPAGGAGAEPGRRGRPGRRAGLVGRPRRGAGAAHRRPVPARVDQQDGDRRRGDAAARRGPAAPRRPARAAPARHAVRATAPSASCSPTSPAPRPRARAAGGSARPGGSLDELGLGRDDVVLGAARRFHYSNLGFGLLGELVARLRGTSWEDAVAAEVLAPLGMTRTTPRPVAPAAAGTAVHPWADVVLPEPEHHAGVMAAAGQLWATLDRPRPVRRVPARRHRRRAGRRRTLEEMAVPAGVDSSAPGWSAYGLGLQVLRVDGRTLVGHGGSMPGFLAGVFVDREEQIGAVSLANTTSRARRRWSSGCWPTCAPPSRGSSSRGRPSPSPGAAGPARRLVLGAVALRAARGRRRAAAPRAAARPQRPGQPVRRPRRRHVASAWTATSPARRCASPRTTWTSARSSSPARPTTPRRRCPAAWTSAAGADARSSSAGRGLPADRSKASSVVATTAP